MDGCKDQSVSVQQGEDRTYCACGLPLAAYIHVHVCTVQRSKRKRREKKHLSHASCFSWSYEEPGSPQKTVWKLCWVSPLSSLDSLRFVVSFGYFRKTNSPPLDNFTRQQWRKDSARQFKEVFSTAAAVPGYIVSFHKEEGRKRKSTPFKEQKNARNAHRQLSVPSPDRSFVFLYTRVPLLLLVYGTAALSCASYYRHNWHAPQPTNLRRIPKSTCVRGWSQRSPGLCALSWPWLLFLRSGTTTNSDIVYYSRVRGYAIL